MSETSNAFVSLLEAAQVVVWRSCCCGPAYRMLKMQERPLDWAQDCGHEVLRTMVKKNLDRSLPVLLRLAMML
jgi:rRNA maturation endonuclease Nob1